MVASFVFSVAVATDVDSLIKNRILNTKTYCYETVYNVVGINNLAKLYLEMGSAWRVADYISKKYGRMISHSAVMKYLRLAGVKLVKYRNRGP